MTNPLGCPNELPIDRVNDAVLKAIAGDVLRPVSAIIDGFFEHLSTGIQDWTCCA
jgi:hypothetical protein